MTAGRRAKGEGSITKRKDGLYEARYVDVDGKRRSIYGRRKADVATELRNRLKQAELGLRPIDRKLTVREYLESWLQVKQSAVRPSTYASYESHMRSHVYPHIGHIPILGLTKDHVNGMLAAMAKTVSARTCGHVRTVLRTALGESDGLPKNVAREASPPKVTAPDMLVLAPAHVEAFTASLAEDADEAIYLLGLYLGLRLGEVLGMRWRDIDFDDGHLNVTQTYQRVGRQDVFGPPKSQTSRRRLRIEDPAVLQALLRRRDLQAFQRQTVGTDWQVHGGGDLVFTDGWGRPRNPSTITRRLHTLLEAEGLPSVRFHDLRHTLATTMIAGGENTKVVGEILGHTDVSLTLRTYTHVSEGMRADALKRLGRIYRPAAGAAE